MDSPSVPRIAACFAAAFLATSVSGGDEGGKGAAVRREFRQSTSYPYTFTTTSYLETEGPKPLRFAAFNGDCANRSAPTLPKPTPTPEPVAKEPAPAEPPPAATPQPAFPPPVNAPSAGGADLTKMPDEVMSYFKNPYDSSARGSHLFDPIFEPSMKQGPQSKATYRLEK